MAALTSEHNYQRIVATMVRTGNNVVVSLYKVAGFAVLLTILAALASYLTIHLFFFFDTRWITPVLVSAGDEQVIRIESEISEQELARDRIVGERIQMSALIRTLDMHRTMQRSVHQGVRAAIRGGKTDHLDATDALRSAATALHSVTPSISSANTEYAKQLQSSTDQLAAAHLITQDEITARKQQISHIVAENASLVEHNADLTNRLRTMERESDSLAAATAPNASQDRSLTFNVMQMKLLMDNAQLLADQDNENEQELLNRVGLQDATLKRIDTVLQSLYGSPYLQAALHGQILAFVPYNNMRHVWPSQSVYTCRFTMLWCAHAGTVVSVLPGEVQGKDPVTQRTERGVLVQLNLVRADIAEQQVLYVGKKPLWI